MGSFFLIDKFCYRDVTDESCEVIIETTMEKKCEDVPETKYRYIMYKKKIDDHDI